jgi:putative oxidoreductase
MELVGLMGRLLFVSLFVSSGVNHFRQREGMTAYTRSAGAPAPELMVPLTGAVMVVAGLLIAFGVWADLGALLLAAFLFPAAYYMHAYWKVEDPEARHTQQIQFMKNMSLAGASLVLAYLFAELDEDIGLALGGSLL